MPTQPYEPLSGAPDEEPPYLMPCSSHRERGLVAMVALACLVAGLLLITAVFMHMEYMDAHSHAEEMEKLCLTTTTPPSTEPTTGPPCTSPGCVTAAARILDHMDLNVDPCQDFYRFSCGRFPLVSPRPSERAGWGQFSVVRRRQRVQVTSDLLSRETDDLAGPAGLVRRAFQRCTNTTSRDLAGVAPLVRALQSVGGWPALAALASEEWNSTGYSWSTAAVLAQRYTGIEMGSPLVKLSVSIDERNASRHLLHIDQPLLAVTRGILVDPESHAGTHAAYERLVADTLLLLLAAEGQESVNQSAVGDASRRIRQFEIQLATITVPEEDRRNISRMYNRMTVNQLQELTDQVQPGTVPWAELIGQFLAMGADSSSNPPDGDMEVVVVEPEFLKNLTLLLNATDDSTLANYISWWVAKSSLAHLGSEAGQALFEFKKVILGTQSPSPVEQTCYRWLMNFMGPGLSHIFITKLFPDDRKEKVATMVSDIGTAFRHRLSNITWMDNSTQQQAFDKLDQMVSNVAYPDWMANATGVNQYYQGFEVQSDQLGTHESLNRLEIGKNVGLLTKPTDRHTYFGYPSEVNAFYEPTVNALTIPAAILAPPFYGDGLQVLNYGAIGTVIGHEFTHGFDDVGSQYDGVGNLVSWWSDETRAEFTRRADCVVEQYGNYSLSVLEAMMNDSHVNGRLTLGENIADNGGLARAYEGYFDQYISKNGPEPTLPALSNFTADQLFFISFAQLWCSYDTPEYLRSHLLTDPHSPRRERVHGTLSNSAAFSAAFSCPSGTPMNPEHKCIVW